MELGLWTYVQTITRPTSTTPPPWSWIRASPWHCSRVIVTNILTFKTKTVSWGKNMTKIPSGSKSLQLWQWLDNDNQTLGISFSKLIRFAWIFRDSNLMNLCTFNIYSAAVWRAFWAILFRLNPLKTGIIVTWPFLLTFSSSEFSKAESQLSFKLRQATFAASRKRRRQL